ncbi:MAG: outer membrane lipoprotein-sorting protein [Bacteroidales bacterium]|nr:outer membrane lipoprotein-sorting protein [Bacteroidales bacterium]
MKMKCAFFLAALLITAAGMSQTARQINEKATDVIDYEAMEMLSTLKIYDSKGSERVRQITTATRKFGETNKTMIKFISPPDVKGTAMLIYDYKSSGDDMWIYLPALRKTRRIVSHEKGKNFMGSEFTNADMSKPNMNDFQYKILGTEDYEGKTCWKIESACNNETVADENGFSRKISYIEKETYLCHKVEFYDIRGDLHKTQYIRQYKKQPNGKYFAYQMEMKNEQNGRKSILIVDKFQTGSTLPESAFTAAMLEK